MVNRVFVERYLRGRSPIGLHVSGGLDRSSRTATSSTPRPRGSSASSATPAKTGPTASPSPPSIRASVLRIPHHGISFVTAGDPAAAAEVVRRAIYAIEPARSVYEVASLEQRMGDAYAQNRLRTWLLSLFAITALTLVCAGVYGTLSYAVSLRRREVALRLALGALRRSLVRQLVSASLRIVGIAAACGLGLALLFTRSRPRCSTA